VISHSTGGPTVALSGLRNHAAGIRTVDRGAALPAELHGCSLAQAVRSPPEVRSLNGGLTTSWTQLPPFDGGCAPSKSIRTMISMPLIVSLRQRARLSQGRPQRGSAYQSGPHG
jgi:hypothetical protein